MEAMMRKQQQQHRRAREALAGWDELQSRQMTQFAAATSALYNISLCKEENNYGVLLFAKKFREELFGYQLEYFGANLKLMEETLEKFHSIVKTLNKIARDSGKLLQGGSGITSAQMHSRVGLWPSLAECLHGLESMYEMHKDEYELKSSVISCLTLKTSSKEVAELQRLLIDQPNIRREEVQSIFDAMFPEEM